MAIILYDKLLEKKIDIGDGYFSPCLKITNTDMYLVESHYHGDEEKKLDPERYILMLDESK